MEACIKNHPQYGRICWLTDGKTEIGVALDFGIRVVHLSCAGTENLYYAQPGDLSDGFGTADTWKLRGGHRMWLSPEGEHSYYPDDDPVCVETIPDGIIVEQKTDPWQNMVKTLKIVYQPDGTIRFDHNFRNVGDSPFRAASWGVNTMAGYGTAEIGFSGQGGFTPTRTVSLWGNTNLHDSRIRFTSDGITATHAPSPDYFKIGVYSRDGVAVFRNKGQQLTLRYEAPPMDELPDGGCNFELYMGEKFMELEVLGAVKEILPGESVGHTELLTLSPL